MTTEPLSLDSSSAARSAFPPWLSVVVAVISAQIGAALAKQLFEAFGFGGVVFLRTFLSSAIFLIAVRPRVFGLLLSLEPVAAVVMGWLILHEHLGVEKIAGIALVTIAATARSA